MLGRKLWPILILPVLLGLAPTSPGGITLRNLAPGNGLDFKQNNYATEMKYPFETLGGAVAAMDYDGDGTLGLTVFAGGPWHFYNDNGSYNKGIWVGNVAGQLPVPGDYNGDGTDEPWIFRAGAWLPYDFNSGAFLPGSSVWTGNPPAPAGGGATKPAPLDYDGDGTLDFTFFGGGPWHFYNDNGSYNKGIWVGKNAVDKPISRRPLP